MKKIYLLLFFPIIAFSQVGINTTTPNAQLDIQSSSQSTPANTDGILIPKIDSFPAINPTVAQQGMLVYLTTIVGSNTPGFYFWDNPTTTWISIKGTDGGTLDQAYDFGGAGNGKTITADTGAVLINGTDGLVSTGTLNSGAIAPSGAGTRMVWNPRKAAFRAGGVSGTLWDDANIGFNSIAFGINTLASANSSMAFGSNTFATADFSTAFGTNTNALGLQSTAFGGGTNANGDYATAFGQGNISGNIADTSFGSFNRATGGNSTAFGQNNLSAGFASTAFGNATNAGGTYATSFGNATVASGESALAFGSNSQSSGTNSLAFGNNSMASALGATAFGENTQARFNFSTAFGQLTLADGVSATAFGNGSMAINQNTVAFGNATMASGINATAFGNSSNASNNNTLAFGNNNQAMGINATSFGSDTTANSENAVSFGDNTTASGTNATSFGFNTLASGVGSLSFGENTTANGFTSVAFGSGTISSGLYATAFGNIAQASGSLSLAFGDSTQASGGTATAFGSNTIASGNISTTFGLSNSASGTSSTAYGVSNSAPGYAETVIGIGATSYTPSSNGATQFSTSNATDRLFVVGNAIDANNNGSVDAAERSDAIVVLKNGLTRLPSTTNTMITAADGKAVVTKEYLQSNSSGTLDQAYDFGGAGNGKTITADAGAVLINGTDGLVSSGTLNSGALAPSGAGVRMVWNPRKVAFRAGRVFGTEWDDSNIGVSSTAFGIENTASGISSTAFGDGNIASGESSTAFGRNNVANGDFSTAFGKDNTVSADASIAFGGLNNASGGISTAFGFENTASGYVSTAFGISNTASAIYSTAFGSFNTATAVSSTAFGTNNTSFSFGETTFGIGATSYTPSVNGTTQFRAANGVDRLFVIGNAIDVNNNGVVDTAEKSDAILILKNGLTRLPSTTNTMIDGADGKAVVTKEYLQSNSSGTLDQAYDFGGAGVGRTITADAGAVLINGTDGLVSTGSFGSGSFAPTGGGVKMIWNPRKAAFRAGSVIATEWNDANIGTCSVACGQENQASGYVSTAFGYGSIASGSVSTVFGRLNTAGGIHSTAFGSENTASGNYSTAFGRINTASGAASTAFGNGNSSSGSSSTAFGSACNSSGIVSTAFGNGSNSSGDYSTAFGKNNTSSSYGETVLGIGATTYTPSTNGEFQFRTANATDRLFVVGNAIDANNNAAIDSSERSDAMVILKNGNIGIGTSTPTRNFHVLNNSTSTTNGQLYLEQAGTGDALIHIGNTGARHFNLGLDTSADSFKIGTNATTATAVTSNTLMNLEATGEVGIGTTAPLQKLHVSGPAGLTAVCIGNTSTIGTTSNVALDFLRGGTANTDWRLYNIGPNLTLGNSGDELATINDLYQFQGARFMPMTDGTINLGQAANKWNTLFALNGTINTSDARQKKNVQNLTYGLKELMELRPVTFEWKKDDGSGTKIGLIAQELQKVVPEVVRDWDWEEDEQGNRKKVTAPVIGVYYSDLIPVIIRATQEQQLVIEQQKEEIKELKQQLENQNTEILQRLEKLENKD